MSPKIVDKSARRREIAEAAINLFASRGFAATSMAQISKRLGIGKGTLYEYFDSKDDLYLGALKIWIEQIEQLAEEKITPSDNAEEALRHYAVGIVNTILNDPYSLPMHLNFIRLALNNPEMMQKCCIMHESMMKTISHIDSLILQGIKNGLFPGSVKDRLKEHTFTLITALDGIILHALMPDSLIQAEAQTHAFMDIYLRGLKASPSNG